ncbi:putative O-methyltransferase [Stachybotrys elegans]|uniref:O-methyltransferase n=1 Tax=Stachybotrys elegans TaxID=80388 RepID=A0A8K0SHP2_9HYPO|nr:putative O-methyltransferase [Stachybotrys elegans]
MASQTPNMDNIAEALKQVAADGNKLMTNNDDPAAREQLVKSARNLLRATKTPVESLLWHLWAPQVRVVAARIAVDMKIFETAVGNGGNPKSAEDLAAPTGASPMLVKRIARACVSMGWLDEQGPGIYAPNEMTKLLAIKEYASGIIFGFDARSLLLTKMPAFLRETGFQNPEDPDAGPFKYATAGVPLQQWLIQEPLVLDAFFDYIHTLRQHRPSWVDMYPVQSRLVEGLKPDGDSSVFVDVGGNTGQILKDFVRDVPQYKGRLVLQDTPTMTAAAKAKGVDADGRIEIQAHDFMTPQPIKGARAYFMRSVLHDWPDKQCRTILGHLKDAMEPGYSRILISDCVVSDQNAAWQHVSLDIFMMGHLAARERTESEWHALMESCGLKIVGIYSKGDGNESVIEATIA